MAKLLLKWDLTRGDAKDLSGNGWDGMFYGGINKTPNPKGIYMGGNGQFINSSFKLPVDKDYHIIFKMSPSKFSMESKTYCLLVDRDDKNGTSIEMRPYDHPTANNTILGVDKVDGSFINNPHVIDNNKFPYPSLYDGTEKTVVFSHPGTLGKDIQTFINNKLNATMKYATRVYAQGYFNVGTTGELSYLGYMSSVEVYEGIYLPVSYAVLRPDTGDVFSFNTITDTLTIPGKIDEMTPELLKMQGTDLKTIHEKMIPRIDFPFKIITIK